jgi:CubicO group peptidase (beta-lactamase class C family)
VVIDRDITAQVVAGVANVETREPVGARTQFRVASVAKMYIAAIALRMVERGDLSLDERVGTLGVTLPASLASARDITLRQLLSHTSGLSQTFTRDEDRGRPLTIADRLDRIPPPVCEPSACWSYADGNYVLLEAVLETVVGRSLSEVFDTELLTPLALDGTRLVNAAVDDDPLPSQYALVRDDTNRVAEPGRLFEQSLPRSATLVTTAGDAASFADALFAGDVVSKATLTAMLDTSVMRDLPCPEGCKTEYGLGVFHYKLGGHELVGHDGSSGTIVVHDRMKDLTVAILTNGGDQAIGAFLEKVLLAIDS